MCTTISLHVLQVEPLGLFSKQTILNIHPDVAYSARPKSCQHPPIACVALAEEEFVDNTSVTAVVPMSTMMASSSPSMVPPPTAKPLGAMAWLDFAEWIYATLL